MINNFKWSLFFSGWPIYLPTGSMNFTKLLMRCKYWLITCICQLMRCKMSLMPCINRLMTCIYSLMPCKNQLMACKCSLMLCTNRLMTCIYWWMPCKNRLMRCKFLLLRWKNLKWLIISLNFSPVFYIITFHTAFYF